MQEMPRSARSAENREAFNRQWVRRCSIQILVMVICFALYYLGLFGGVEGPLSGASLADLLVRLHVSGRDILFFFLGLTVLCLTWNWGYNLFCFVFGRRLTCNQPGKEGSGGRCGAPTLRRKGRDSRSGRTAYRFHCRAGHVRETADFRPLEKGIWGNMLWLFLLAVTVMIVVS